MAKISIACKGLPGPAEVPPADAGRADGVRRLQRIVAKVWPTVIGLLSLAACWGMLVLLFLFGLTAFWTAFKISLNLCGGLHAR